MNPAKSARLAKEARPWDYCHVPKCLWNISRSGPCEKHMTHDIVGERCEYCGYFKDEAEGTSCRTFQRDPGNPLGFIPVYGSHSWEKST